MALTYRLHAEAKKELTESVDWYEKERKGRGAKFFIAYLKTLKLILSNPLDFPQDFDEVRKTYIQSFLLRFITKFLEMRCLFMLYFNPDTWKNRGV